MPIATRLGPRTQIHAIVMSPSPAAQPIPDPAQSCGSRPSPAGKMCSVLMHLLGESIVNRRGERLGSVDDLLIDPASGCIAYAVMAWGGFMGRGERQLVLPWRALRLDGAQRSYVLEADDQRLQNAPCIDRERWPSERSREWHLAVHRHYDTTPYWH